MNTDNHTIRLGTHSTPYALDVPFTLDYENRLKHMHIVGQTGTGKSTLLENLFLQDVYAGNGGAFFDPHGKSARNILKRIPPARTRDVIYFDPADTEHPIGFNILQSVNPSYRDAVTDEVVAALHALWRSSWGARMDDIFKNTVRALLDAPTRYGSTLLGVQRMLTDDNYRAWIVGHCKNPDVVSFFRDEFDRWHKRDRAQWTQPVLNKVRQFHRSEILRHILGQSFSTIDLSDIMDKRRLLIVNLDKKAPLGEDTSNLLGSLLLTGLYLAAVKRFDRSADQPTPPFYIYADEFQNITSETVGTMFSEIRKGNVSLTIAHQFLSQLSDTVASAVFGNVATLIAFRVGGDDAPTLARNLDTTPEALVDLADFEIRTRTKVNDMSITRTAKTDPPNFHLFDNADTHIAYTRSHYTTPVHLVADRIERWRSNSFLSNSR